MFVTKFLLLFGLFYPIELKTLNLSINGGKNAPPGSAPYLVHLTILSNGIGGWNCAGAVISPNYILTSAICLDRAHGALVTLPINGQYQQISIETFKIHENFNKEMVINDIALIKLKEPMKLNENLSIAQLPPSNINFINKTATLYSFDPENHNQKQYLKGQIIDNKKCSRIYKFINSDNICLLSQKHSGTCNDDHGAVLDVNGTIIGLVSYTAANKMCKNVVNGYSVFTNVQNYLNWIKENSNAL